MRGRTTLSILCLAVVLAASLVAAPAPAAAQGKPNLEELVPVYRELVTDTQYLALKGQLRGNLENRKVVDRYLKFLPISPLSILEIDMRLNRFEFQVPKLIYQWHMRWLELHPDKAEKLYGVTEPPRENPLGAKAGGATIGEKAATVTTNRNAAFNYALPPEEYQGEIQVAVNPNDPSQIVAAANTWDDQGGNCGDLGMQAVFYSNDGGVTWGYTCTPDDVAYGMDCSGQLGGQTFGSDPAVHWNDNNQVHIAYMMLCYNGDYFYSIVDAMSSDGGATWQGQGVLIDSWSTGDLEDKEFIAIDNNAASPFYGRMYACWDRNNDEKSAYSTDNGQTWTEVDLPATPSSGGGGISSPADLSCEMAVEDDGTVHIVYNTLTCGFNSCSNEQKFYARSTNGGQSWSSPVLVRDFNLVGFSNNNCPDAQDNRCIGPFGAIDIDNTGGTCDGTLYVAFTDHDGSGVNTSDVFLTRSTDDGATWGAPVKINDDTTSNVQFHPFLVVDQSNGSVVVAWHDARNDAGNDAVDYYVARSTDCGLSFETNVQASQPSTEFNNATISSSNQNTSDNPNYNPNQYGEYLGLDVLNGTAYLAWSDTRHFFPNFTADTQQENLGFATVTFDSGPVDTEPPAAPTGLAATAGEGVVDLDWADNSETDLAGYNVYRSTTSGSGYSQVNGSLVTTSAYSDSTVTGGTTYFYVVTAVDTSSNESGFSNEASATPTEPVVTTLHVDSIVVGTRNAGGGNKYAQATVTIVDETGAPVGSATVTGDFTGDVTDTQSGATAGDGMVLLETGPTKGRLNFTFCVTNVTHGSLTYAPGDNVVTCASN